MKKNDLLEKAAYLAAEVQSYLTQEKIRKAEEYADRSGVTDPELWQAEFCEWMDILGSNRVSSITIFTKAEKIVGAHASLAGDPQTTVGVCPVKGGDYAYEELHHGHDRSKFYDSIGSYKARSFTFSEYDLTRAGR